MGYRYLLTLKDEEIKQFLEDLFRTSVIIDSITREKDFRTNEPYIDCDIQIKYYSNANEDRTDFEYYEYDNIILYNPFETSEPEPMESMMHSFRENNFTAWKNFCFAKKIVPWLRNNPYLPEKRKKS